MQLVDHVQALITLILGQVGWLVQWVQLQYTNHLPTCQIIH